jgi:hypothetical protein
MEFGLKIFAPADRDSALYCLPDGTELEVSCVELIGEEVPDVKQQANRK